MAERALAFIIEGKPDIAIRLERNDGFDQTVPTNGDGYALFARVPQSPWDVNIHIHTAGYEPYDHVLGSLIPGGIPPDNHNLFVGRPAHPVSAPFDIVLPPLVSTALPKLSAGRWDFFDETGARHMMVSSTELLLAWRYDVGGAEATRPIFAQRRDVGFNDLRCLWQKDLRNAGNPWQMPLGKLRPFLALAGEYGFYISGCILADCAVVNPHEADQQRRVAEVREATVGISNHVEELGNEYEKNGFDPWHFSRPTDRMASSGSNVEGGRDGPYWDYFLFSGRRRPEQAAIREYGPIEFIYGAAGWGGLPAVCSEGMKPGQTTSDPRAFERAGAQGRSANGFRFHSDAGTAGESRLFNSIELTCGRAMVRGGGPG